jgi:hypothetical protein
MTQLQILTEEAVIELSYLNETVEGVNELLLIIGDRTPTRIEKAASSQYISQYYNGIENILKRIAKYNKFPLDKSESWHKDIINLFCENSESKKLVLFSKEQYEILHSFRKIRHVMRQGYDFRLDWDKLNIALQNIPTFLKVYESIIMDYINSLKE